VAAYKKKVVFIFLMVALIGGLTAISRAKTAAAESPKKLFDSSGGLFAGEPNFTVATREDFDTKELVFRMMLSVLLVIVLGTGLVYFVKRFGGRITGTAGKKIRVIETVALGTRRMVHLVEVGEKRILIGSTNENITMLADVTDALGNLSNQRKDNE
jgi:flagellar biosynthetic protein FliO